MAAAVIPVIVLVFVVTIAVAITLIALSVLVVTATRTNHGIRTDRVGNIIFLELTGRAILAYLISLITLSTAIPHRAGMDAAYL